MKSFCDNYSLKSLIRKPICYENFEKPTCIDLILTNMPHIFKSTCVIRNRAVGLSSDDLDCYEKKIEKKLNLEL